MHDFNVKSTSTERKTVAKLHKRLMHEREECFTRSPRHLQRWALRAKRVFFTMLLDDGSCVSFTVFPRDISAGGMAVHHGGFVCPGVRCLISMQDRNGIPRTIRASVVRCGFVVGRTHLLGIKFDETLRVHDFVEMSTDRHCENHQSTPHKAVGTLLCLESDLGALRAIERVIESTDGQFIGTSSCHECMERLVPHPGLILASYEALNSCGEWMSRIRNSGYTGPVVMTTTDLSGVVAQVAHVYGTEETLTKPLTRRDILRVVTHYLHCAAQGVSHTQVVQRPSRSVATEHIPLSELETCAARIRSTASELQRVAKQSIGQLRTLVLEIERAASSHGFDGIATSAQELVQQIERTMGTPSTREQLDQLIAVASAATADG